MATLSPRLHAIADYFIALLAILSPALFNFGEGGFETMVLIAFGLLMILHNLVTDYPLGISRQIPLNVHLRIDNVAGVILAISPWLLRFNQTVAVPHVLFGLGIIANSVLTAGTLAAVRQVIRQKPWHRWSRLQ